MGIENFEYERDMRLIKPLNKKYRRRTISFFMMSKKSKNRMLVLEIKRYNLMGTTM